MSDEQKPSVGCAELRVVGQLLTALGCGLLLYGMQCGFVGISGLFAVLRGADYAAVVVSGMHLAIGR